MIISVDTGNKQIKTIGKTFTAGLVEHDGYSPFGSDVLKYNGKYYTLSENRIPYMADKTKDDRYFVLTLFAIAYELIRTGNDIQNDIISLTLLVGLPPAHYMKLAKDFKEYFLKEDELIEFEFNRKRYCININDVKVYPQAYAAIANRIGEVKCFNRGIIIDIGGFTADILQINNGKIDLSVCYSEEKGTIQFYNELKNKISSTYGLLIEERDIDRIICKQETTYNKEVIELVNKMAQNYMNDFLNTVREYGIDLKSCVTILTGGGSLLFRDILRNSDKIGQTMLIYGLNSNAKGYETLYHASMG